MNATTLAFLGSVIAVAALLAIAQSYCFEDGSCKSMNSYQYAYWNHA